MKKIPFILIAALLIGLIMRGWQIRERFMYGHDNDLASWFVKDVIVDKHLRLIGQETSAKGIFIGPLWYYSLIPFYLITGMDPVGSLANSLLISLSAICSLYFVVSRLYGFKSGGIASLLYAGSELISTTEREVVPTTCVMLWSIWFFYAVNMIFQGKKSGIWLAIILIGLVWHINLALILLSPLIVIGVWLNRQHFKLKDIFKPLLMGLILMIPLLLFEFRHGFIQSRSLFQTLTTIKTSSKADTPFSQKISHVIQYAEKNATKIFFIPTFSISYSLIPISLIIILFVLFFTKKIPQYTVILFVFWMSLYLIFFSLHPINLSEYYLNGMNIFWIIIAAVFMVKILPKMLSITILCFLLSYNLNSFLTSPVNASGYLNRKDIINYIFQDAVQNNYPCVSLSYITSPGSNLGYRYFVFLKNLKTVPVSNQVPVYTIVYPHSLVDKIDKSFGALALVLPDYSRYDRNQISLGCSGSNYNLTEPMFGFTK